MVECPAVFAADAIAGQAVEHVLKGSRARSAVGDDEKVIHCGRLARRIALGKCQAVIRARCVSERGSINCNASNQVGLIPETSKPTEGPIRDSSTACTPSSRKLATSNCLFTDSGMRMTTSTGPTASVDLSIVICTRNRADRLDGVLSSLAALRSERTWEVLLVDNASTDDTMAVLQSAEGLEGHKRVLLAETIGLGAARDFAWRSAKGELITFTDDDCYLQPDFVDAVVTVFAEKPRLACVGGRILLHDPTDAKITIDERETAESIPPRSFVQAGWLQGANLTFRRSALEAIGGIDPALGAGTPFPCEDVDAVATTVWAGLQTGFDPRPVVRHHHGRKVPDLPKIEHGYDLGRGAYYAKSLLHGERRATYLKGWLREAMKRTTRRKLAGLRAEFIGARQYLLHRKKGLAVITATPFAHTIYAALVVRAGARRLFRRSKQSA